MSYVISSLPDYTNQPVKNLIYEKLYDVIPTLDYCNIQTGIKSAETIELISTRGYFQAQACSFNASGSTTFTQRTLTVGKIKVDMKWCEKDLEAKYTQQAQKPGSTYTSLTFNSEIIEDTTQNIAKDMETAIWLGDTASGNATINRFDGFVKIIGAASIGGTYSGTTWSEANSRTAIKGLAALVAANTDVFRGGNTAVKFFMAPKMIQEYRWKLAADNLFHNSGADAKVYVENSDIELVAVPGLAGTNYIFAIEPDNMFFGTDLMNEQEKYKVWYSQDNDEIRFKAEWKAGVQVAFPSRIYRYLGV